ncbi:unnamed protein product, partial [Brassica oleracea var. botrytis]
RLKTSRGGCRKSLNRLRHWRYKSSLGRWLTWRRFASNEKQKSRVGRFLVVAVSCSHGY